MENHTLGVGVGSLYDRKFQNSYLETYPTLFPSFVE